ncbi:act minimal PKS acyl carrier protein [Frankia sp. EI5c]|uniref:acyl carrier protein n=1 Tax=Frankia sp. EI5c TaxID=683316 RepID=UPI0007C26145|nr:acyl carrier protein [Frankia sp. EI5c]OAA28782.1 act minimal PKS acyl carrier protein [Frankia sp. EI5c]
MNTTMTIDELREILVACAGGGDDEDGLRGDISDVTFEELGYDSLALIETAARLRLDHDVVVPDEEIAQLRTPRDLLDRINSQIGV